MQSYNLNIEISIPLPRYTIIFLAELRAIIGLLDNNLREKLAYVFSLPKTGVQDHTLSPNAVIGVPPAMIP